MDQGRFLRIVANALEMDDGSLHADMVIKETPQWSSLAALSLIMLLDENYHVTLEGTEILNCRTFGDMARMVEAKAAAK